MDNGRKYGNLTDVAKACGISHHVAMAWMEQGVLTGWTKGDNGRYQFPPEVVKDIVSRYRRGEFDHLYRSMKSTRRGNGKRYAEMKASGLCAVCGEPSPDRVVHTECAKKYANNRLRLFRKDGKCVICRKHAAKKPFRRCNVCLNKNRERIKEMTAKRVSLGLCGRCGKHPIDVGKRAGDRGRVLSTSCLACAERNKALREKKKQREASRKKRRVS